MRKYLENLKNWNDNYCPAIIYFPAVIILGLLMWPKGIIALVILWFLWPLT